MSNAYETMRAEIASDPLAVLETIAEKLRETAEALRRGKINPHHAANRIDKLADIIAEQDGDA